MDSSLTFTPRQFIELYARGAYDELSEQFLAILRHFAENSYQAIDFGTQRAIDAFVVNFLNLFAQPDYLPNRAHGLAFIEQNLTISNLAAVSSMKTTDPFLEIIQYQENSLAKILALYSARNRLRFDRSRFFFAADPQLAANWYAAFGGIIYGGLVEAEVCEHLREHYFFKPPLFPGTERISELYFGSSYVGGDCDRPVKQAINSWLRSTLTSLHVRNRPNPRKIAIISCMWWRGQSSHRALEAYVEALKEDYDLTLFYVPMAGRQLETAHFHRLVELKFQEGVLDVGPLLDNDFMVAFFPEIGMTAFSIWLANLRIAPIQIAGQGHYASTWGADIDYFLSGADVETPDHPERHYSERLVLLPGCGVEHNWPDHEPGGRTKTVPEMVINCLWTPQKVNHRLSEALAQIVRKSKKPLRWRIFAGDRSPFQMSFVPFQRKLSALLAPSVVEIPPSLSYQDYMALVEEGDFALDSYPMGGSTTVLDSLYLRKPVVTWEGDRWCNRVGSQIVRKVGLPELIATSEEGYIELALRLIHDDVFHARCTEQLRATDLKATIWNRDDARYFKKAIDYLIANHERLKQEKDRSPIRIERD